jgi:phytoene dehydrogenase-like protein
MTVDAVVIGAGPNGLVAANLLTDAGWDVVVLEAQSDCGGAVRSDEHLEAGFVTDRFSAFYPLGVVSPHLRALELERHGLVWRSAETVLAHPTPDGPSARLHLDRDLTAASLDAFAPGDGDAWRLLSDQWDDVGDDLLAALFDPFPPIRAATRLLRRRSVRELGELARRFVLPVRRLGEETFTGAGGSLLLGGAAQHADVSPTAAPSGLLGWLLCGIGQHHGWPVPATGSSALTAALVRRLEAGGGTVLTDQRVVEILVGEGGAEAVVTADGVRIAAAHAVVADVVAPKLFGELVDPGILPSDVQWALTRFQHGSATFKVNWTLDAPIPWTDPELGAAGTVHIADSVDELTITAAQLSIGLLPTNPFVLVGQMDAADPERSPEGKASIWAYADVPQAVRGDAAGEIGGLTSSDDIARFADRMQQRIAAHAPGFESVIRRRSIQTPASMEADDANLVGGDKSLGTAQLHQQLIFRPHLGMARAETAIPRLFLASASAHPGGGVHGACGANAARAAMARRRTRWVPRP